MAPVERRRPGFARWANALLELFRAIVPERGMRPPRPAPDLVDQRGHPDGLVLIQDSLCIDIGIRT